MRQLRRNRHPSANSDHLAMSIHYASTPGLSSNNSVESNSVNSDDYDLSSTGSSSVHYPSPGRGRARRSHPQHYDITSPFVGSSGQPHRRTASVNRLSQPRLSLIQMNDEAPLPREVPPPIQAEPLVHRQPPTGGCEDLLTVSEDDVSAIEACYRGHKTRVYVCVSLANLYTAPRSSTRVESLNSWNLLYTGIPVLLLDLGNTKSRQKRQIQILLVEKGTCFTLWRDVIDHLSKYTCQDPMFHVMHLSHDHLSRVGLSFDHRESAQQFHSWILSLTSDPANIALKGPSVTPISIPRYPNCTIEEFSEKAVKERKKQKYRKPSKAEISLPCGFQHVVSVDMKSCAKFYSVQAFVKSKQKDIHARMMGSSKSPTEAPTPKTSLKQKWGSSPNISNKSTNPPLLSIDVDAKLIDLGQDCLQFGDFFHWNLHLVGLQIRQGRWELSPRQALEQKTSKEFNGLGKGLELFRMQWEQKSPFTVMPTNATWAGSTKSNSPALMVRLALT
eukprot:snap_masked-scaffold56_size446035-processed-gene-1.3 protein:Tk11490 transcript:snap_masked-scaffold56_size446035-processed-gene-1.3-mRNA-1 annotation:"PREDICTED: uncharacterized protein LOC103522562"